MEIREFLFRNRNDIIYDIVSQINRFNPLTIEKDIKKFTYSYIYEHDFKNLDDPEIDYAVNEFCQMEYLIIKDRIQKKEEELIKQNRERDIRNARDSLFATIDRATQPKTIGQARQLKYFKLLLKEDQERLYQEYLEEYNKTHEQKHQEYINIFDIPESFNNKIKKFVIEHPDEFFEFNDFQRVIKNWNKDLFSDQKCYEIYKDLFYKQPENNIQYNQSQFNGLIGFKNPKKVKALQSLNKDLIPNNQTVSSFPLKQNMKLFQLHKVSSRNSYLIDLMMIDHLCYLVAININTRYLYVKLTNIELDENKFSKRDKKSTKRYLNALRALIDEGMNPKFLSGDGEKAFNSIEAQQFYTKNGIRFISVPRQFNGAYPKFMINEQRLANKTSPLHTSLGLIDRVIRTLRDMAYNMKVGLITPNIMKELVYQYNNAPHQTLSKYAGFPVSPKMTQDDKELEEFIVRRIMQENYNIQNRNGFNIKEGTNVKVYNETDKMLKRRSIIQPGEYQVIDFNNGLYKVRSSNGKIQFLPRWRLAHMFE